MPGWRKPVLLGHYIYRAASAYSWLDYDTPLLHFTRSHADADSSRHRFRTFTRFSLSPSYIPLTPRRSGESPRASRFSATESNAISAGLSHSFPCISDAGRHAHIVTSARILEVKPIARFRHATVGHSHAMTDDCHFHEATHLIPPRLSEVLSFIFLLPRLVAERCHYYRVTPLRANAEGISSA